MNFRRKIVVIVEPEKVSSTIKRLEVLAEHLENTAHVLETMVRTIRDEDEVQPHA